MKELFLGISILFISMLNAQEKPISDEEISKLRKFEGVQIAFEYNKLLASYIYSTQTQSQVSTDVNNPNIRLFSYVKLNQLEDVYCFSDIQFSFNITYRDSGVKCDSLAIIIGFQSNIKNGDAINYGFSVKSDVQGNFVITGKQVEEFLSKSIETKKPLNFNFYREKKPIGDFVINYAKVSQKLGGIIKTRDNLAKKYVICTDN